MKKKFVTEGSNRTKSQLTAAPCPGFPVDSRDTNVPTGQRLVEGCFADELKGLREFLLSVYCGVRWSAKPSDKKFMFEIRTNLASLVIVFQILAYSALPSPYNSSLKFCTLKKKLAVLYVYFWGLRTIAVLSFWRREVIIKCWINEWTCDRGNINTWLRHDWMDGCNK